MLGLSWAFNKCKMGKTTTRLSDGQRGYNGGWVPTRRRRGSDWHREWAWHTVASICPVNTFVCFYSLKTNMFFVMLRYRHAMNMVRGLGQNSTVSFASKFDDSHEIWSGATRMKMSVFGYTLHCPIDKQKWNDRRRRAADFTAIYGNPRN